MVRVLKLFDFRKCELPEKLFDIRIRQADIDAKIEKAAEHFLTIAECCDEIRSGDIVAVKIDSADPLVRGDCERFCVGKGFFIDAVDRAVVGRKKGDSFSVDVDGEPAQVSVLWVRRRVVPELTDDMAARMGIEDVTDVRGYTEYVTDELVEEEKEKKRNGIWLLVSKKLLGESEFEVDEKEIDAEYERNLTYLRGELEGDDFEEFMQVKYHGKTLEESCRNLRTEIGNTMKLCAIAAPMAEEDGVEFSREDYDAEIDGMVSEEYSREELEQSMSYEDYVMRQQEEFLKAKVLEYFDGRFTVAIV